MVRVVDYRLQALAAVDPEYPGDEMEWGDISMMTTVSQDRETMYQLAREHGGLLLSGSGLPSRSGLAGVLAAIEEAAK